MSQIGLEQSPEEYIEQMVEVMSLVRDCLADDGTLWLNIGDSYYNYRSDGNYPKQSVSKTRPVSYTHLTLPTNREV